MMVYRYPAAECRGISGHQGVPDESGRHTGRLHKATVRSELQDTGVSSSVGNGEATRSGDTRGRCDASAAADRLLDDAEVPSEDG